MVKYLTIFASAVLFVAIGIRIGSVLVEKPGSLEVVSGDGTASLSLVAGASANVNADIDGAGVFWRTAGTPAPKLSARAAVIIDPKSGEVLFNYNSGIRWPLASLTKLMTAHVVLLEMDLSKSYDLVFSDFNSGGTSLTRDLFPGGRYSGEDLLKIMLVSSSNEAADAFARIYGRTAFIQKMNSEAKAMGLSDTVFTDPSGISPGNRSTARDFSELSARVIRSHAEILSITRQSVITAREENSGMLQAFQSTNQLVSHPDFLGGKTGTTPEAGENLLVLFSYRSHPVMILLFGSENRFAEVSGLFNWFTHDFIPSN